MCHGKIVYDFHDMKLPITTNVIGFKTCFKSPPHFLCHTGQSQVSCRFDAHETICVVDLP